MPGEKPNKKVAIVGDTDFFRIPLSKILEDTGLPCVVIPHLAQFNQEQKNHLKNFDLIILNLSDPHFDGLAKLAEISEITRDGRSSVWVIENVFERHDTEVLKKQGVKGVLSKAVPPELIQDRIKSHLIGAQGETRQTTRISTFLPADFSISGKTYSGYISSLSTGGAYIQTDYPPLLGTEVDIKFLLRKGGSVISTKAVVLYISKKAVSGKATNPLSPPGMGVRFKTLEEKDKEHLKSFIETSLKSKVDDYQVIFGIEPK